MINFRLILNVIAHSRVQFDILNKWLVTELNIDDSTSCDQLTTLATGYRLACLLCRVDSTNEEAIKLVASLPNLASNSA